MSKHDKHAELAQIFASEDAAREFLESRRWSNGPVCPHCGSDEAYKLQAKEGSKRPVRPGVHKCKACRKQFTVTVGTIFEASHIPLTKWLHAIHLMCASKKGVSAHQLHRMLGVTYKSAWFMAHRVRHAMANGPLATKLEGWVEVDETYVGGKTRGGKRGRGADKKTPVVALVSRKGPIRVKPVYRVTAKNLKQTIRENVAKNSAIVTDEFASYTGIGKEFEGRHYVVNHSQGEYVRGLVYTNTAESFFALLKRGVHGTFHHVSKEHLGRYCDEFAFRWENRESADSVRMDAAIRKTEGKRLCYREVREN